MFEERGTSSYFDFERDLSRLLEREADFERPRDFDFDRLLRRLLRLLLLLLDLMYKKKKFRTCLGIYN